MLYKNLILYCLAILIMFSSIGCASANVNTEEDTIAVDSDKSYHFPHEGIEHEGTWLQWPHNYTYDGMREAYEPIWIEMTRGLVKGENVHLIVYNEEEKEHVQDLLEKENIDMTKVDFYVFPTDDVWVRDNGPIFAYDEKNNLVIQNWQFNGWGNKMPYTKDNSIPSKISEAIGIPKVDIDMVMEGGALELDGNGTCISTLSCVNNDNRTPDFTIEEIEEYITEYYGATNFIWLDGVAGMEITDDHIDGMVKFYDDKTIIAAPKFNSEHPDFLENDKDTQKLLAAKNINGDPYEFVFLPSTKNEVAEIDGEWIKGSYVNFYLGNKVVLVPNYDDENDEVANEIIQDLYPDKEVIGIDVRALFANGGMIHCVTQQQPISIPKQ